MNTHPGRYSSLDAALRDNHLPLENDPQIRHFVSALGITDFYRRSGYIQARRPAGAPGRALHIHYGYTNGFASEEEALDAAFGIADPWKSNRGWGVTHLENMIGSRNRQSAKKRGASALPQFCPIHGHQLPATGRCDDCP